MIVAGPCSAESASQVLSAAEALAGTADIFRAGLWKPRTMPGSFEGAGPEGLPWLLDARRHTGLPVAVEVLCADHVRLCLEAGLDAVWIGARTTANPFLVQEIADALKGSALKVLLKNPTNPDRELWCGALKRLFAAGLEDIVLVHRGFTPLEKSRYRNDPRWGIALGMRTKFPSLPMLCDPSHIAGDVEYVPEVAQRAMDLGYDGLMVECHPDPEAAKSDSRQQMDPESFVEMVHKLQSRRTDSVEGEFGLRLESLRAQIDELDSDLVRTLSERMRISSEIGALKKDAGVQILQTTRWEAVLAKVRSEASSLGLDADAVEEIYNLIHGMSVQKQK